MNNRYYHHTSHAQIPDHLCPFPTLYGIISHGFSQIYELVHALSLLLVPLGRQHPTGHYRSSVRLGKAQNCHAIYIIYGSENDMVARCYHHSSLASVFAVSHFATLLVRLPFRDIHHCGLTLELVATAALRFNEICDGFVNR